MPAPIIPLQTILAALSGQNPPIGHRLTQAELGQRLAAHRQGRYPGQPFTKQAISLYAKFPDQQSPDFVHAFRSWVLAETQRQADLSLVMDGMTVDELLAESAGRVVQLGDSPARLVLVIGQLPPNAVIIARDIPRCVLSNITPRRCTACDREFLPRSWNHRRCGRNCPGELKP